MITFVVGNYAYRYNPDQPLPQVALVPDGWNDWWEFETLYSVVYFDADGKRHHLGSIKVGEKNMSSGSKRPNLPPIFVQLAKEFFVLGQDVEYYETIKDFGDEIRENIHTGLNDIAFDEGNYESAIDERVTTNSLMRSVSQRSVKGQFRRLAQGDATLTNYSFTYTSPRTRGISSIKLEFEVISKSNPPSNIHVIIGRNGVGKTHLFNNMIQCLTKASETIIKYGKFESSVSDDSNQIFANLVSVSFSAFDETEIVPEQRNKLKGLMYSNIGLRAESTKAPGEFTTKSPLKLKREFARSAYLCKIKGKLNRLRKALESLESDMIFNDADMTSLLSIDDQKEFETEAAARFHRLSSGHKVVLLTITRLVETVEERSLVLIDEPESHLHPPLLSAFIRALSDLLVRRNAVAIVTTHSPVVLQEVPSSCCWKMRRTGVNAVVERLEIESFGENVGSLTQEVFGLEVTDSGFHKLIKKSVSKSETYNEVVDDFGGQLGFEAKAIVRALLVNPE